MKASREMKYQRALRHVFRCFRELRRAEKEDRVYAANHRDGGCARCRNEILLTMKPGPERTAFKADSFAFFYGTPTPLCARHKGTAKPMKKLARAERRLKASMERLGRAQRRTGRKWVDVRVLAMVQPMTKDTGWFNVHDAIYFDAPKDRGYSHFEDCILHSMLARNEAMTRGHPVLTAQQKRVVEGTITGRLKAEMEIPLGMGRHWRLPDPSPQPVEPRE